MRSLCLLLPLIPLLAAGASWNYPAALRSEHVDDYHGTKVADPYRWMEELDSPETRAWIAAERQLTSDALAKIPERAAIRARLTQLWNYPKFGLPTKRGGHYFFTKNDGLQNQSALYVQDTLTAPPRVLVDPNRLSTEGTVALAAVSGSPDGKWLAYGLASAGSDWQEFHLCEVATGKAAPDLIKWAKFSGISWTQDSAGFFYARYPEVAKGDKLFGKLVNRRIYYHRLGTTQDEDRMVFELPEQPDWFISTDVTDDGRYLVFTVEQGGRTQNALYYRDLIDPDHPVLDGPVVKLLDAFDANYTLAGNQGATFFIQTNRGSPHGKVIAIDLKAPAASLWKTLIPESVDNLDGVNFIGGRFVAAYLHDVQSRLSLFAADGKPLGGIDLPEPGTVTGLSGRADDPELFVGFSSFLSAPTVFRRDLDASGSEVFQKASVGFDAARYETQQIFYPSKDGTKIPMFITHRRGLKLDGHAPTWLYGYGGFGISLHPQFAVPPLVWLEMGGVYAQANLRGGGEYGEPWHLAGTKERKQNVFDDFIAAADWLVANGYTARDRLVVQGRSNGGLLVGAVLNQRPDLCAVGIAQVGVMDMLRFHKFTIGAGWVSDYGSSDTPEGFTYLRAYSPLHNIRSGASYPAVLVTTGDHDDRVFPAHSFKYTAALQAAVAGGSRSALIRIESNAGHGGSSGTTPVSKTIDEWTDMFGFATANLPKGALQVPTR
jgi:prolyl oligopeptidase